ncbi:MAG: cell division protein FtsZ [Candidatus Nealsonbacteria bacterium CG23_combo_of_CG06-09_8_20_14_all_36_12]|uniref:Cell division protein FtsZ n=1 Tax=Candidatus Nealsonbacteria bacterium CG23_combo_of_CG06-09_8_20_14_all_36_12 TaxID=1974718 RepID=A0A2G9Z342_9BACT|nr:MAG: cell division protein FtsZ [Candidatus Nealsonbacteria bacterium CG23_combo_of_CG06-09_8_20_14_all_36_12]
MPKNKQNESFAKIKVIGVGGSGSSAVSRMMRCKLQGVDLIAINTDAQDLHHKKANLKLQIGKTVTGGLGAGMNPELGRAAAEENRGEISEILNGADMIFITCGLGGGTGSGASPIVAEEAKKQGALTIAVVTKPFSFEGTQRTQIAEDGLFSLKDRVDALLIIPNDKLLGIIDSKTSLLSAFWICDEVLRQAVQGISDLIVLPGIINVDFADIKSIMENSGSALMGVGRARGKNRAVEAAQAAINSPLLDISIEGARGVLFNVSGREDMTLAEINEAAKVITEVVDPDAKVIFGAVQDERLRKRELKVTVIATGFEKPAPKNLKIFEGPKKIPVAEKKPEIAPAAEEEEWEVPAFLRKKAKK